MESLPTLLRHSPQPLRSSPNQFQFQYHYQYHPPSSLSYSPLSFFTSFTSNFSNFAPITPTFPRSHSPIHKPQTTPPPFLQTLISLSSPFLRTTLTFIAAAAFFYTRLHLKPTATAIASPIPTSSTEENLSKIPHDADALRSLIERKVRARKIHDVIPLIDRLIELEPQEIEWPLFKARMCVHNSDYDSAKEIFEEILKRDPCLVEAYQGLVMANSESKVPLDESLKRIEEAVELCRKEKREAEVRDLRLLIAQMKVMEGELGDALKAYEELVREEPEDFRPYFCQGVIYIIQRKRDEAKKQFENFWRFVPEDHPYRVFFEGNMFELNAISQKVRKGGAAANN